MAYSRRGGLRFASTCLPAAATAFMVAFSLIRDGTHDTAVSLTVSLTTLVEGIEAELPLTAGLGRLGGLLGMLEPFADALHELLLESAHHLSTRAVLAVLRTRRPVELAFAHLRTAGIAHSDVRFEQFATLDDDSHDLHHHKVLRERYGLGSG